MSSTPRPGTVPGSAAGPARRRASGLALGAALCAAVLGAATPALASPHRCASVTDQELFELEALKTELVVIGIACHTEDRYNAFVRKFQPELARADHEFGAYFARAHGRGGQRLNDEYVTQLANGRSQYAHELGSDFCPRNSGLFTEVMALDSGSQLAAYAAGKDLVPETLGACAAPIAAAAAPSRGRAAPARRGHHR